MIIADVMDALANAVRIIPDLKEQTYAWPNENPPEPSAIVTYPEDLDYDQTGARGSDEISIDVVVLVGVLWDEATRDRVSKYANGSGVSSVKTTIENFATSAWDSVRVERATFETQDHAGITHLAAIFTCDIIGPGS